MDVINTGLIGYGKAAQVFHAPLIQATEKLHLKTVVERHKADSKKNFPWVEVVRSAQELFDDPAIDLVVIATPNSTHYNLAREALLSGKHVVVDKPITITSAQAGELVTLANQRGVQLSVFQNRRWDGDFITVSRILKEGKLGRLVEFESHFDRFRKVRKEGWREDEGEGTGILYDLGSHLIDQALILFGLPGMVMADLRVQRDTARVIDNFELILFYPNLKVTLKAGMLVREPQLRFILHGTEGSYVKAGLDPQEDALKAGRGPGDAGWGKEDPERWGKINTDWKGRHIEGAVETDAGSYEAYYANIADVVSGNGELLVRAEEALQTIRVIELALESHQRKCAVPFS